VIENVTFESKNKSDLSDRKASKYLTSLEAKLTKKWGVPARLVAVRFIDDSIPANPYTKTPEIPRYVIDTVWQSEPQ
jgi:hypothetical protein